MMKDSTYFANVALLCRGETVIVWLTFYLGTRVRVGWIRCTFSNKYEVITSTATIYKYKNMHYTPFGF